MFKVVAVEKHCIETELKPVDVIGILLGHYYMLGFYPKNLLNNRWPPPGTVFKVEPCSP